MANPTTWHLLPPDLIELQLGQLDLLAAMYPDELSINEETQQLMEKLREGDPPQPTSSPITATVVLLQPVTPTSDTPAAAEAQPYTLEIHLSASFTYMGTTTPDEPPAMTLRIQQPAWLSRAATATLTASLPAGSDILESLASVHDLACTQLTQTLQQATAVSTSSSTTDSDPLVRVWFYFPSISTRAKRTDLITHAPTYHLTGFLYAGKPGLLCVEGASRSIDAYMRFIKTESWGDIPAGHKKVSERLREEGEGLERCWGEMREITDEVGGRKGMRANRADLGAVEEWLATWGLQERVGRVVM
jgi:hypothetical protein